MSVFQVKVCFRYGPIFTYQTKIRKEKIRNPLYPQWIPLADPGDVRPHLGPISFNFMQFSKKTLQNNRFLPQSQRFSAPCGKSWIHTLESIRSTPKHILIGRRGDQWNKSVSPKTYSGGNEVKHNLFYPKCNQSILS